MKAQVVEISGYLPAIMSLYMTGKNCTLERLDDIRFNIGTSTTKWGFVTENCTREFKAYMDKVIKYGVKFEHEAILDFIKISVFTEGLHRGAQDDFDAHSKRMDIIRSSTRANKKSTNKPEISEWYVEKVLPFFEIPDMPDKLTVNCVNYVKSSWGYVQEDLLNNPDVLRGNVGLSVACDNISTMSFRNWRHVYHLRRRGTQAAPEIQDMVEQVREDLYKKCWWLGEYLGKVWTEQGYYERDAVKLVPMEGSC